MENKLPAPEDTKEVCDYVDMLFEEAASYRRPKEKDWTEYERFYNGDHWKSADKKPKTNWVFQTIESEVPILTDSQPGSDVIATEDERNDDAKVLKEALDYVYYCNNVSLRVPQAVRSALIATNSYLYVDFDPDKSNGEGEVVIKNLPWRYVYLDPSEGELEDANYTIIRRPVKVDTLKRIFPNNAEDIEPEDIEEDTPDSMSDMYRIESRYHSSSSKSGNLGAYKPQDMAYLVEAWVRDFTSEPISEEESAEILQQELDALSQGIIPEVTRYMDHAYLIAGLQQKLSELGFVQQQEQMDKEEAASVGPQIVAEEVMNKVQDGSIPDEQSAVMAHDELMMQLDEHVNQQSENDVLIQLIQDLIEQHHIASKRNMEGTKPRYPGNLRLIVKVQDVILYDGPTPVPNGMVPLTPIYAYKLECQPYSDGEVKNILDDQKAFNELNWDEHQSLRLNSNSGWIIDDNSGIDETSLTNEPGIVLKKKAGTEASRLPPGTTSPQLANAQVSHLERIQRISGINEVTQGIRPKGVDTVGATNTLLEQSVGRIRLKSRTLENSLLRLGQIVTAFVVKYWDKKRLLRNYDDDGRIQTLIFDPERLFDLEYQVRIAPGSTFGISKEAILSQTKEMLQGGAIDAQMFFEINRNNIPYAAKILQRLKERDELTQQAQMLAEENAGLKAQMEQLLGPQGQAPATASQPGNMLAS